jgi:beta-lactamase class A
MKSKMKSKLLVRIFGIVLIIISLVLSFFLFSQSQSTTCTFPEGSTIGGIDVGRYTKEQAKALLMSNYEQPLRLSIDKLEFELAIDQSGTEFNYDGMVESLRCEQRSSFEKFWKFIWNWVEETPINIDLLYTYDEAVLQQVIDQQISPMVEKSPIPASRISGTTQFIPGENGYSIDKVKLVEAINQEVLKTERSLIRVETKPVLATPPTNQMITDQLKEIINESQFGGVVEIFAQNLTTNEKTQLLMQNNEEFPSGVAFTAASTMKIPILISTYWRNDLPLSEMMTNWVEYMVVFSENDPADRLMEQIDSIRGPLLVTNDMQALGFENTFIGGYFYLGAPLLNLYQTPANQRTDVNINPDVYNQTTPEEVGELLVMIYQCAEKGEGVLIEESKGSITSEECHKTIEVLSRNQMGALIEAGLPENTTIAHKHGWSQERDGLVHSFSDVGIIYGPENDFVLTVFLFSDQQLLFDVANPLIARISQTIFNAYNLNHQIAWPFPEN